MARRTYPGALRRRKGHWWWRLMLDGRRYSRSFDALGRHAAERHIRNVLLPEVEAEDQRVQAGQGEAPRMSALLASFETDYHGTRDCHHARDPRLQSRQPDLLHEVLCKGKKATLGCAT